MILMHPGCWECAAPNRKDDRTLQVDIAFEMLASDAAIPDSNMLMNQVGG